MINQLNSIMKSSMNVNVLPYPHLLPIKMTAPTISNTNNVRQIVPPVHTIIPTRPAVDSSLVAIKI